MLICNESEYDYWNTKNSTNKSTVTRKLKEAEIWRKDKVRKPRQKPVKERFVMSS